MATTQVKKRASLAGWLFADLSIVLSIVFISSRLTSEDSLANLSTSSTTTTLVKVGNSLDVEPIKVPVQISDPSDSIEVVRKLEDALRKLGRLSPNAKFGVVIVHAGLGGPLDEELVADAKSRATKVAESLKSWNRLTVRRWVSGDQYDQSRPEREYQFTLLEDLSATDG
jgi:hypothetical protein